MNFVFLPLYNNMQDRFLMFKVAILNMFMPSAGFHSQGFTFSVSLDNC